MLLLLLFPWRLHLIINKSSLFTNKEGSSEALGPWQASIGIQSLINAEGKRHLGIHTAEPGMGKVMGPGL